jgi:hypothetical protein
VTDHADQLRKAFETHEDQTPDPAEVYARVQELARGYRWRRRGAQVAGGAVLGAGLVAGMINLPGLLPAGPSDNVAVVEPGAAAEAPSPSMSPSRAAPKPAPPAKRKVSATEQQKRWDAYFGAGYGYGDAVALAKIWKSDAEIGDVKAEAGRRLLAGETLPVKPQGNGTDSTSPDESRRLDAFFAAGYNDAVELAGLWRLSDPYQAKIMGGGKLLAGETLPIRP